ncbi:hypothetical protein PTKIN_Ptkin11bG0157100 [Pterospermum kingtungense]
MIVDLENSVSDEDIEARNVVLRREASDTLDMRVDLDLHFGKNGNDMGRLKGLWFKLKELKKAIEDWFASENFVDPYQISKLEEEIHELENQENKEWEEVRQTVWKKRSVLWSLLPAEE